MSATSEAPSRSHTAQQSTVTTQEPQKRSPDLNHGCGWVDTVKRD